MSSPRLLSSFKGWNIHFTETENYEAFIEVLFTLLTELAISHTRNNHSTATASFTSSWKVTSHSVIVFIFLTIQESLMMRET